MTPLESEARSELSSLNASEFDHDAEEEEDLARSSSTSSSSSRPTVSLVSTGTTTTAYAGLNDMSFEAEREATAGIGDESKADDGKNRTEKVDPGKKELKIDETKLNSTMQCLEVKDDETYDKCRLNCDERLYSKNDTAYISCYKCCREQLNRWAPERCPLGNGRPCNGNGKCDNGVCQCNHLFEGSDCTVPRSPRSGKYQLTGSLKFAITVLQPSLAPNTAVGLGEITKYPDAQNEWKFNADGRISLAARDTMCLTIDKGEGGIGKNGYRAVLQQCSHALRRAQKFRLDRASNRLVWTGSSGRYALTMNGETPEDQAPVELEEINAEADSRQTWSFSGWGVHFLKCSESSCNYKDASLKNSIFLSCFMDTCSDIPNRRLTTESNLPFFSINPGDGQGVYQDVAHSWQAQNNQKIRFSDVGVQANGIGEYPNGNITFWLQPFRDVGYVFNTFRARVGIDNTHPCSSSTAGTEALVYVDGKLVYRVRALSNADSFHVKVSVLTASRIDLVTRVIGSYCNFLSWGEAKLSQDEDDGTLAIFSYSNSDNYGGPWAANRAIYGTRGTFIAASNTLPVQEGDIIYSVFSTQSYTNCWQPVNYRVAPTPGSNAVDEIVRANPSSSYYAGYYLDQASIGAFRARAGGTVQLGAEAWNSWDGCVSTHWNGNLISLIVRNKNLVGSSGDYSHRWGNTPLSSAGSQDMKDLKVVIEVPAGASVWATLSCNMQTPGSTIYGRTLMKEGGLSNIVKPNWITITNVWGGWSNGVSQSAYKNTKTTAVKATFTPDYHGHPNNQYAQCSHIVRQADGPLYGADDDAGYNQVNGNRLTWSSNQRWTDFEVVVPVKAGDVVYGQLSCNLWNHAWHHVVMGLRAKDANRPPIQIIGGNFFGNYYHSYWDNGLSAGLWKATGDGTITLGGLYWGGWHYSTYVYCNIIAENLGPADESVSSKPV